MGFFANINGWPRDASTSEAVAETYEGGSHMGNDNTREITLTKGKVAIVDAADYEWLSQWNWMYGGRGYAVRSTRESGRKRTLLMHRLILSTAEGMYTDHINGDRLDNRRSNLRACTNAENGMNRGKQCNNTSGFKGVYFKSDGNWQAWQARINSNGKRIILGYFKTPEEAAIAYNEASLRVHGEFARSNSRGGRG